MKNLILSVSAFLYATQDQSIQDYIDSYVGENARPYLQPLANLLTSTIHTGVWEWSAIDKKFYVRLKAQGAVSFPTNEMRTITGTTTGDFQPQQTATVPTVIGDKNPYIIRGDDNTTYIFPGGYDLKRLMLGSPRLTLGGLLNSEVSGRFLTYSLGRDLGRIRFIGLGVRHSITGYFANPPFDFATA